ncbi:DUF4334 domain-containing protein [Streptomyces sp. NPDC087420]|uniref:DUF4334 domain-containing protein n=1 Tax=Streptomyces sp. NPDC087420 TaxID=3365785 RepID=UPI0038355337
METKRAFDELRSTDHVSSDQLTEFWPRLTPVTTQELLGRWRGGMFATGHAVNGALEEMNWYGKQFNGPLDVKPLLCRNEAGEIYSNTEPCGNGEASMWSMEFRDEVTAALVYDCMPWVDHFARVDDSSLMAVMEGKLASTLGVDPPFYFWLEREAS